MPGDILNPTAGTSLDCGLFAGGVFKGACWCASFPNLCGDIATPQQAAQAAAGVANPNIYDVKWQAPGLPAVSGGYVKANESTDEYDAEVANSWKGWSDSNARVMDDVWERIQTAGKPDPTISGGIPAWAWVAIAVVGGVVVIGGLRR